MSGFWAVIRDIQGRKQRSIRSLTVPLVSKKRIVSGATEMASCNDFQDNHTAEVEIKP